MLKSFISYLDTFLHKNEIEFLIYVQIKKKMNERTYIRTKKELQDSKF